MATNEAGTPVCDFCEQPALYDSPTRYGPWAHTCGGCLRLHTNLTPESKLVTRLSR